MSQKQQALRRLANTISIPAPHCCHQHPKYKPHSNHLVPQSGLAYTHPPISAHLFLVHSTPLSITPEVTNDHLHRHHPCNVFPSLRLSLRLRCHGIIPERSLRTACLCDDAHVATRSTLDVRVTRKTFTSRRKVEQGEHGEHFQGVKEEVMMTTK
jgi:hypothetical protein